MSKAHCEIALPVDNDRWPSVRLVVGIDDAGVLIERPMKGTKAPNSSVARYQVRPGLYCANIPVSGGKYRASWYQADEATVVEVTASGFDALLAAMSPDRVESWRLRERVMDAARKAHPIPPAEVTEIGTISITRAIHLRIRLERTIEQNASRAHVRYEAKVGNATLSESTEVAIRRAIRSRVIDEKRLIEKRNQQLRQAQERASARCLPALTGTQAQVRWATSIRDGILQTNPGDPRLKRNTTAAFWIDNRKALSEH